MKGEDPETSIWSWTEPETQGTDVASGPVNTREVFTQEGLAQFFDALLRQKAWTASVNDLNS